jgi:hypothetical protein
MIGEEDEDIVSTSRLQHSLSALTLHKGLVSLQDSLEHFGSYMRLRVINLESRVDIHSLVLIGRLVEDLSLVGVRDVMGDIVVGQSDDAIGIETTLDEHLVGMVDVGLVTVVGPCVRTRH